MYKLDIQAHTLFMSYPLERCRETGYQDYPEPSGPQIPRDCQQCDRVMSENGGPIAFNGKHYCSECATWHAEAQARRTECPCCPHVFSPGEKRYAGLCRSCASEKFAS